jgi:hypothetical protein
MHKDRNKSSCNNRENCKNVQIEALDKDSNA